MWGGSFQSSNKKTKTSEVNAKKRIYQIPSLLILPTNTYFTMYLHTEQDIAQKYIQQTEYIVCNYIDSGGQSNYKYKYINGGRRSRGSREDERECRDRY